MFKNIGIIYSVAVQLVSF